MAHDIEMWLERILGHEGGYVADSRDPGGETKWGISKRAYPDLDIAALTASDAADIYRRDYLEPLYAHEMPAGVAFQLLDAAVNSGVGTAVRWLQRAIGVADDGVVGPVTLKAVVRRSSSDLIMLFLAQRIDYLTRLSTWSTHGKGWMRRIAQDLRYGADDSD